MGAEGDADAERRHGLHLLSAAAALRFAALLFVGIFPALVFARPVLTVEAEISADLRRVWGLIRVEDGEGLSFADPLARLPEPEDDLVLTRTYSGPPEQGSTRLEPLGEGLYWFETRLPRRLGDLGVEPGEAMWANGGFLPQPLVNGRVAPLVWTASARLPPGVMGALNGVAGEGALRFEGVADRLSLAAMVDGRLTTLAPGLTLLERGPRRHRRDEELRALYALLPTRAPLLIVETGDQRRLARPGPGMLFLAELAFRLTPPLPRLHRAGVLEGMLVATLDVEELWWRQLAARALAQEATARARAEAAAAARLGGWIPVVDALVYSGRAPFHAEVFSETYPGDPLRDDLAELFNPEEVGGVAAVKLDDRYGPGTASALTARLLAGDDPPTACAAIGVPLAELLAWRAPTATQDLRLSVRPALGEPGWRVEVRREAPPEAPVEPVVVVIDGERYLWDAPPGGSESWSWPRTARPGVSSWIPRATSSRPAPPGTPGRLGWCPCSTPRPRASTSPSASSPARPPCACAAATTPERPLTSASTPTSRCAPGSASGSPPGRGRSKIAASARTTS
ncbi:hypothetical protein L6R49_27600 [Myxococcota bacterium]|nr:hypothetical protein [Myxococcota bacterium]